jgi:hypothetical protein
LKKEKTMGACCSKDDVTPTIDAGASQATEEEDIAKKAAQEAEARKKALEEAKVKASVDDDPWKKIGFASKEEYDECQKMGFASKEEYDECQKMGFDSKEEYDKCQKMGCDSKEEYDECKEMGCDSKEEYDECKEMGCKSKAECDECKEMGCKNKDESDECKEMGCKNKDEWDRCKEMGFTSKADYDDCKKMGCDGKEAYEEFKASPDYEVCKKMGITSKHKIALDRFHALLRSRLLGKQAHLDARADEFWTHCTKKKLVHRWRKNVIAIERLRRQLAEEESHAMDSASARARRAEGYTDLKLTPAETMAQVHAIWEEVRNPPLVPNPAQLSKPVGRGPTLGTLKALRDLRAERAAAMRALRGEEQPAKPTPQALLLAARQALADEYLVLPKEEKDRRKFSKLDPFYLPDLGSLNAALADGSTALLRGDFIERLAEEGQPLGHRAELPPEAFYEGPIWLERKFSVEQCMHGEGGAACVYEGVLIVAVTYAWQTPNHPDPHGEQLRDVARFLRWLRQAKNHGYYGGRGKLIAVFWDWASLYQDKPAGSRSEEQTRLFDAALHNLNLWYCHPLTLTLMNRRVPLIAGQDDLQPSYDERGWPAFERTVSEFVKGECGVVDLQSLLSTLADEGGNSVRTKGFYLMASACGARARSKPPLSPDAMSNRLVSSHFSDSTDVYFVQKYYRRTFEVVLGKARELYFGCMKWVPNESWLAFCSEVLPQCERLEALHLDGNPNLKVDIAELVDKLPPSLKILNLEGTGCFGDSARANWARLEALERVNLDGTRVFDSWSTSGRGGVMIWGGS